MSKKFTTWDEFEKELNITPEQELEIQLEMDIIKATIEARKKNNLTQRELSEKSGVKQPAIARIEKGINSPRNKYVNKTIISIRLYIKSCSSRRSKIKKGTGTLVPFKKIFLSLRSSMVFPFMTALWVWTLYCMKYPGRLHYVKNLPNGQDSTIIATFFTDSSAHIYVPPT